MQGFRQVHASILGAAACAVLWAGAGAATAAASTAPELVVSAGSTLGVTGSPGRGGVTSSLAMLWPVEGRYAFGVGVFADDLGTGFADLHDPNTGIALGTVASTHRWSYGGEWRAEMQLHNSRRVRLLWGAGFGYGRQEIDQGGDNRGAASAVVASTGATFLWKAAHGHAFGTTLAYRRELVHRANDPDRATSWATAALEWRWQGTPKE